MVKIQPTKRIGRNSVGLSQRGSRRVGRSSVPCLIDSDALSLARRSRVRISEPASSCCELATGKCEPRSSRTPICSTCPIQIPIDYFGATPLLVNALMQDDGAEVTHLLPAPTSRFASVGKLAVDITAKQGNAKIPAVLREMPA